jgi:hypothetical protein
LVRELIRRGLSQRNAHRIINESTGQAAMILKDVLKELIELKARSQPPARY